MKIEICKDYEEVSCLAADYVANEIKNNSQIVLGLATGATPIGVYKELIKKYNNNEVSFKNVSTFNLDEYIGVAKDSSHSYYTFMHEMLFNHIDVKEENINIPDGNAKDFGVYADEFESRIKEFGGIDLQILGIGKNAHIGFNEPTDVFSKQTSVVKLAQSTIDANSRFFESIDDVPKTAISMGIGTIFAAKKIILLATGKSKAEAIRDTVKGDIKPQVPSSILQLHRDVTLIIDEEAASLL